MARHSWLVSAFAILFSAAPAWASAVVAVVNIPLVSEKYQKTADLEARFEAVRLDLGEQRKKHQEQIERAGKSLSEEFKPGTPEFDAQRKKLAMLDAELQWFVESEGKKVERGLAASLREIFDDIQLIVRELAEEKGIDIVLAADQMPSESTESPTQARQQILLQKVLYWSPSVDITEEVVERLNVRYRTQGSKTK